MSNENDIRESNELNDFIRSFAHKKLGNIACKGIHHSIIMDYNLRFLNIIYCLLNQLISSMQ